MDQNTEKSRQITNSTRRIVFLGRGALSFILSIESGSGSLLIIHHGDNSFKYNIDYRLLGWLQSSHQNV
jgi:hypothetical protein